VEQSLWSAAAAGLYNLETPKHEGQGDFATNFAMIVAGKERRKPREVAEQLAALRAKGLVYEQEGATWFKTTEFGQAQDCVIIKNTGEPTCRLPDIACHREKFRRGLGASSRNTLRFHQLACKYSA
jgi:arginyl-tRNA synthetase